MATATFFLENLIGKYSTLKMPPRTCMKKISRKVRCPKVSYHKDPDGFNVTIKFDY